MKPTQPTTTPASGAQCECYIVRRNGEPLTTMDYDKNSPHAPSRIILCKKHASVDKLLADRAALASQRDALEAQRAALLVALKVCQSALMDLADAAGDGDWFNEGGDGYEAIEQARAAIKQAEEA